MNDFGNSFTIVIQKHKKLAIKWLIILSVHTLIIHGYNYRLHIHKVTSETC